MRRSQWQGYLFVAPAAAHLVAFTLVPMAAALWLSLHRWHLLHYDRPFVGWQNYVTAFNDPFFRHALLNTFLFSAFSVPLGMALALGVALLVNQRLPGMRLFRTLYYVPAVTSGVAMAIVWIWVFMPQEGLINHLLRLLGCSGETDFLNDCRWAMPALVLMNAVVGLGPRMVIFLAGLQGIPDSLYDAARVDGSNAWQRFRHVTLPLLTPTTFFVLVTSTISAFQLFTPVYVMTGGGPRRTTDVVVYHIYQEAWHKLHLGMASAQSYILFAAVLAISVVQFRLMRRRLEAVSDVG